MSTTRRAKNGPRDGESTDAYAVRLKERVYATFTGLAIVLVLAGESGHLTPERAAITLFIGIVAISLAGFVAEIIAHTVAHESLPNGVEAREMLGVSGGALGSASAPLIPLLISWWGGALELDVALRISTIIYLVALAAVAYIAVRRTKLRWWLQLGAMVVLVLLGALVIGIQTLAHHGG